MNDLHPTGKTSVSRILLGILATFVAGAPALPADLPRTRMSLVCTGVGTQEVSETTQTNAYGKSDTGGSGRDRLNAYSTRMTRQPIQGTVRFSITDQGPRIRLFPGLMPSLNVGNAGKWREIENFRETDSSFKGRVSTGILSEVEFEIDRHNGDIQVVSPYKEFTGTCAIDRSDGAQRKF